MSAFGVHGCSVVSALTAQNTVGVQLIEATSDAMFRAQLDALVEDLPPAAIKTGMLGGAPACKALAGYLPLLPAPCPPLVCDPVLQSTSGAGLFDHGALELLIQGIFPKAAIVTPNLPEAEKLVGPFESIEEAAGKLLETGAQSVLIKGGHDDGDESRDYWTDGSRSLWLSSPRIDTEDTHGTGCILSAAIASAIALGQELPEAVVTAKTFLNQCIKSPVGAGAGPGPIMIRAFENRPEDRPDLIQA